MKIAIVGYGKMGRMIDAIAREAGHEIGAIVNRHEDIAPIAGCDVAIEFTEPSVAAENLLKIAAHGMPIVCGTTGWYARLDEIKSAAPAIVYGTNFSIGVAVFNQIVAEAAVRMSKLGDYEAWGWEAHHSKKKDAPSGTMDTLVATMRNAGYTRSIDVSSTRAGMIPGTHEIGFDSAADTITLRHTARNREGFARGAVFAAEWIVGKKGAFEFSEVVRERLG